MDPVIVQDKMSMSNKLTLKLGTCMMCKKVTAKYRCPGCDLVSCSLLCVTSHKKEFECSGLRNKTDFVPVKKMTELDLLSDYRLLEELARVTDSCSRDTSKKSTRKSVPLPVHLQKLRKAVSQRNCRIYFLPKNFARHKENTTSFDWRRQKISWRLKFVFLHAQKYPFPVTKCPEDLVLDAVIDKCLAEVGTRNKELRKHFDAYLHSRSDIQVLLQAEKVPGAHGKMFILDTTKTLRENLEGKRIVEYPILYLVIKGFYGAEALEDITKEDKSKSKVANLLISNYSLNESRQENGLSSSDEDEEPARVKKNEDGNDSEDSLDDALDCLEGDQLKNVLTSLYKQAEQQNG